MSETQKKDVIIIGAGLTGLATAYYLKESGLNIVILEKDDRIGGVIRTYHEDGFVFEAGPNTGVVSNPEVAELFEELSDSCKLEIANPDAKRRLIWKSGQWHALPSGLLSAIKTPLFSAKDKFRILGEPFRKKGTDPFESIADLVLRRLGKSYLDYAVDPFISGIYAGNPSNLITRFALPKLYALEQNYGSFIKGAFKKGFEPKDPRMKKATREVFSAEQGLGSFIQALGTSIGENNICLNAENVEVKAQHNQYTVNASIKGKAVAFEADYVVSTTDAGSLVSLLPFLDAQELSVLTNLEYARIVQVVLGFKKWQGIGLNAFGGLVPSIEKRKILGILFPSSFFKNRAPEQGALLSLFMGGARRPELVDLNDNEIKALVFKEVQEMLQVPNINPDVFRIFRYHRAIPQYGRSSGERLEAIHKIQHQYPGLILAGGIRDGIGMADRIKQAKTIAVEILASESVSESATR